MFINSCISCPLPLISPSKSGNKHLKSASADVNLRVLCIDAAQLLGLVVGQVVHSSERNVEAICVVNGENVDGLLVIGDAVAGSTLVIGLVIGC
jgi:hypothetical protein